MSENLAPFRARIDAIDEQLLDLLEKRSEIVAEVGKYKLSQGGGGCYIRPGREATMVRAIAAKVRGPLHPLVHTTLWRTLIAGSTRIEQNYQMAVYAPENTLDYYWLGREYFGPFTPAKLHPNSKRVLGDILDKPEMIGILPAFSCVADDPWWLTLGEGGPNWPRIFACVPFVAHPMPLPRSALAVGYVTPEKTGDDITVLMVETTVDISRAKLTATWEKLGFSCQWLAAEKLKSGNACHLFEIRGFLDEKSPEIRSFLDEAGEMAVKITLLGAYAAPMQPSDFP